MSSEENIAVIVLAAGGSTRLGRPKQLVEFKGETLLEHTMHEVDGLGFQTKILVLGSKNEEIQSRIDPKSFKMVVNMDWEQGMASSIKVGLEAAITEENGLNHVLFLVSDQPFLERANLIKLVNTQLTKNPKATYSQYGENIGVPAIFDKAVFPLLLNLKGDEGAKKLIHLEDFKYCTEVFKKGGFDVDTEEDVQQLKQMEV
ncbi:nucleotidyltransferase family protein [Flagellimonas zhangzhouensis]|uniref:Molybdenum cofactor cytidylyltransferase n=1 Tax=Flagellimonas zhangzhouensis TaxID=1073328 RepID=A0A1H2S5K1_9FLAO|nr:nucleotidyltransferase family protein [Allomuricauda zhangzhouensis]SDQ70958.1 molybdenum cofactor cytidylyltransferase [Allomuricauda zhangzhouensis]SDW26913.1 molybdenum cofactor cytidylyltransferase [Allomuricauda zhangzhouensis]